MSVRSNPDDWWMTPARYAAAMRGLTVNLLYRDPVAAVPFHTEVLGARADYVCEDFAAFAFRDATWMLHADHSYDRHPLHPMLAEKGGRGLGAELRLRDRDPDAACAAARRLGCRILAAAADKPHGTREAFILDGEGYLWAPFVLLA